MEAVQTQFLRKFWQPVEEEKEAMDKAIEAHKIGGPPVDPGVAADVQDKHTSL